MKAEIVFCIGLLCGLGCYSFAADVSTQHPGVRATAALDSSTDTIAAGYYPGKILSAVDIDLSSSNIKRGVAIFGITGAYYGYFLPGTNQTESFTDTFGEDHDYPGTAPSYTMYNYTGGILVETSDINSSSVTVDNITRLVWFTDAYKINGGVIRTFDQALPLCEGKDYAGFDDWRMPNIRELESIVDYGRSSPAINTDYFKNIVLNYHHSSTTTNAVSPLRNLVLHFSRGFIDAGDIDNNRTFLCVRGGPN